MRADQVPFWELITWRADQTPEARFAVDERGRTLTFAAYRDECARVAAGLHDRGVRAGAPVAWMLPTWLEAFVLAGALARLDALQVPLIPILRELEVGYILRQSDARHLVVPGEWRGYDYPALARTVTAELPHAVDVIVADRALPVGEVRALPAPPPIWTKPADAPVRWVFYTSGTTSNPKGTRHTDATVAAAAHRCNLRFEMVAGDREGLVFPVTHIGGISWLMGSLMVGYSHIMIEAFSAEDSCAVLAREGVTIAGAGPAFWMAYVAEQRKHPDHRVFPHLRALVGGGAPKPATMHEDVRDVLGVTLATGYGLSECPALAHSGVSDPEDVRRGDGHALDDVEIRIVRGDGTDAAPGEVGEIRVTGPMLFRGYLDPADDLDAFDDHGFHRTGDLARMDERGVLTVTGRLKDIIIRKGENISAKEVEDALYRHPAIADVAVIALPDAERGEMCCAVVVLAPDATGIDLAGVDAHCRRLGLARQKVPERLEIVEELPRNPTGKVLKGLLQDRLRAAPRP
ncbi:MAG TPA: AMP-binding protein [Acidimicrobiales bacterium]|nr:AMP-binding protein [Acidimicrobiales bacterium]